MDSDTCSNPMLTNRNGKQDTQSSKRNRDDVKELCGEKKNDNREIASERIGNDCMIRTPFTNCTKLQC